MYQLSSKGLVRTSREGHVELDVKACGRSDGLGFWDTPDCLAPDQLGLRHSLVAGARADG